MEGRGNATLVDDSLAGVVSRGWGVGPGQPRQAAIVRGLVKAGRPAGGAAAGQLVCAGAIGLLDAAAIACERCADCDLQHSSVWSRQGCERRGGAISGRNLPALRRDCDSGNPRSGPSLTAAIRQENQQSGGVLRVCAQSAAGPQHLSRAGGLYFQPGRRAPGQCLFLHYQRPGRCDDSRALRGLVPDNAGSSRSSLHLFAGQPAPGFAAIDDRDGLLAGTVSNRPQRWPGRRRRVADWRL